MLAILRRMVISFAHAFPPPPDTITILPPPLRPQDQLPHCRGLARAVGPALLGVSAHQRLCRTGSATATSARPSRQAGRRVAGGGRPAVCCAPRLGSSTSVLGDGGARAGGVRRDAIRLTVKCRRLAALGARDGMWLLSVLSLGPDFFMG